MVNTASGVGWSFVLAAVASIAAACSGSTTGPGSTEPGGAATSTADAATPPPPLPPPPVVTEMCAGQSCPIGRPLCCHHSAGGEFCGTAAECEAVRGPECRSPADCAGEAACVVSGLGGRLGCTGASCCGADECINGCHADADCPACRPVCTTSPDGSGTCSNPNGP